MLPTEHKNYSTTGVKIYVKVDIRSIAILLFDIEL